MDKEEIKKRVLCRFYDGAFTDGADVQIDLSKFASENGINPDVMNRIHDELKADGMLYERSGTGLVVTPSLKALLYCEDHHLGDQALYEKQNNIRKKILEAFADIYEEKLNEYGEFGDDICHRAGISRQDFDTNSGILIHAGYFDQFHPLDVWSIKPKARDLVKELRKRRGRLAEFKTLKDDKTITPQDRGHRIEDLLSKVIADDGWKVSTRVRADGIEHDILFNRDREYYLISCKWIKKKIQWREVSLLLGEAGGAGCSAGILVSMSGFTDNCIGQAKGRKTPQKILLFGPKDLESLCSNTEEIFSDKHWFTDLLDEKIQKLVYQNKILIDGDEY